MSNKNVATFLGRGKLGRFREKGIFYASGGRNSIARNLATHSCDKGASARGLLPPLFNPRTRQECDDGDPGDWVRRRISIPRTHKKSATPIQC